MSGMSVRRFAKRIRRLGIALCYRVIYFRRYYPIQLASGDRFAVDLWNRNWRILKRRRTHERDVEAFLQSYLEHDDVVVDIGAQIGIITSQTSRMIGPYGTVMCFEPDPLNFDSLKGLCERNGLFNARLWKLALGDTDGIVRFRRPVGSWGASMVGENSDIIDDAFRASDFAEFEIACRRLDNVMSRLPVDRIDLIKLDVDGPEMSILRGAIETITRFRPVIVVEASRFYADHGYAVEDLFAFLLDNGFEIFVAMRNSETFKRCAGPEDLDIDISLRGHATDFFCIPRETDNPRHHEARQRLLGASEAA